MSLLLKAEVRSACRRWTSLAPLALVLGLGFGLASALASVADTVIVRPVRAPTADRLVAFESADGAEEFLVSPAEVARLRAMGLSGFEELAGIAPPIRGSCAVRAAAANISAGCAQVSAGFFALFGLPAWMRPASADAAPIVLSHELWTRRLRPLGIGVGDLVTVPVFDPATFGTRDRPLRIAGIAPRGFYSGNADVWLPPDPSGNHLPSMRLWGLARPGRAISPDMQQDASAVRSAAGGGVRVRPLGEAMVPKRSGVLFVLLVATVGLLLTVWCLATSSLVSHAFSTARGLNTRAALGASTRRLLLEESIAPLLVALAALPLSQGVAFVLHRRVMGELPFMAGLRADYSLTALWISAMLVALFLGAQAALAWRLIATSVRGPRVQTSTRTKWPSPLSTVAAGLAIALVYVSAVSTAAFYRTWQRDYGFDTRDSFVIETSPMMAGVRAPEERERRLADIEQFTRLQAGVQSVVRMEGPPFSGYRIMRSVKEGASGRMIQALVREAGAGVFGALKVPFIAGRDFNDSDLRSRRTTIVTRSVAAQLWPTDRVLGAIVTIRDREHEVIGVVADFSDRAGRGSPPSRMPQVFVPSLTGSDFVVRTSGGAPRVMDAVLEQARLHGEYVRSSGYLYGERRRLYAEDEQAYALFMGVVAVIAILIGGLATVIAITDACRRAVRSVAIRIGIGAAPARAVAVVIGATIGRLMGGVAAGTVAGLLAARTLQSHVQNLQPIDPLALGVCSAIALLGFAVSFVRAVTLAHRTDVVSLLRSNT